MSPWARRCSSEIGATGIAPTDLRHAGLGAARNAVVAALLTAIVQGLGEFEQAGSSPSSPSGATRMPCVAAPVNVIAGAGMTKGLARGIDVHGALLVETAQGMQRFISGDVSVRPD